MIRFQRLRKSEKIRDLAAETKLSADNLIMPYFIIEGKNKREEIKPMPGINRLSVDNLLDDLSESKSLGIKSALLFGVCRKKDAKAIGAYSERGIVQEAIREIKKHLKDIIVISDVCLCGYTTDGHCGIIKKSYQKNHRPLTMPAWRQGRGNGLIDNDATLKILSKIALSHAQAGADLVAPSAMMDGQVGAIREALDKNGFINTGILAYSAKYASNFYGPFREALDSAPLFGDRKSYQMDFRNSDEALREIKQDIEEGADIVMIKPALAYLDIIYRAKDKFNIPVAAYNVSGEYAMVESYCLRVKSQDPGSEETKKKLVFEILTSIKRAGADLIITYHAKEVAKWLSS